ncbi:MAG: hypothetical protein QM771_08650 [Nitrospira sp.]
MPALRPGGRSVELTRAGSIFREHARRALREMERRKSPLLKRKGCSAAPSPLAWCKPSNAYLVPAIVARFSTLHPQVSLKLDELSGTEIEAGVKSG